ncbi:MAG: TolC family protein, partial [Dehalococcoidia bacterium]
GLQAAQQNHRISLAQFKAGTAIALEVFDAADRLASAQLDLARSVVDYNLSQVRVLAATGMLRREVF